MKNIHLKILDSHGQLDVKKIRKLISDEGFSVSIVGSQKSIELTASMEHATVIVTNRFDPREFEKAREEIAAYVGERSVFSRCNIFCCNVTNSEDEEIRTYGNIQKVIHPSEWNEKAIAQRIIAALYGGVGVYLDNDLKLPNFEGDELFWTCNIRHKTSVKEVKFVGPSRIMRKVFHMIRDLHHCIENPILVRGETGTGKELVASAIHNPDCGSKVENEKSMKGFFDINIAEIEDGLLASELFGHEKGSFTNAILSREGMLEEAGSGTVFLDEIGDLPEHVQVKLLRVINNCRFKRIGAKHHDIIGFKGRLIFATHRDLEEMINTGRFRSDFYYRISGVTLSLPPLRERKGDLELLAKAFYTIWKESHKEDSDELVQKDFDQIVDKCISHNFPGNVRRYQSMLINCFNGSKGARKFDLDKLAQEIDEDNYRTSRSVPNNVPVAQGERRACTYEVFLERVRKEYFKQVYLIADSVDEEEKITRASKTTIYAYLPPNERKLIRRGQKHDSPSFKELMDL